MYHLVIISLLVVSDANSAHDARNATTNRNQKQQNSRDDNVLKVETAKYLKDCESDASREESAEDDGRTKHDGTGGTYPEFYGEQRKHVVGDNGGRKRFSNGGERVGGCSDHYDGDSYDNRRNNGRGENRNYREHRYDRNYPDVPDNPFNDNGNVDYRDMGNRRGDPASGYDGVGGFRSTSGMIRVKRDDENCVSQCVFSYMEMLDDNRTPSESAVIKFLKDHVPNDRKRIGMIRDVRRCFAKLATMDNDDGCEFSKSLAKCLKLEME